MILTPMMAQVRVDIYSKTYGIFRDTKAIDNRLTITELRLKQISPYSAQARKLTKEHIDLTRYREAICSLYQMDN